MAEPQSEGGAPDEPARAFPERVVPARVFPARIFGRTRFLTWLARPLSFISSATNAFGTLIVLFLVLSVNADVVARNLFSAPLKGTVELVQFSMVLIVFLQLPDVVRVNRLTRSDGLLGYLAARRPETARTIARIIDLASAVLMGLIAYTMWPEVFDKYATGEFYGTPGIFTAPVWPVKLTIAFAGTLSCLIFLAKAITGSRRPDLLHVGETEA